MLVATFGPSTEWVGKSIVYEGERFVLEGFGAITAQGVLEYDRQAHLEWAYGGLRDWVAELAAKEQPWVNEPSLSDVSPGATTVPSPAPVFASSSARSSIGNGRRNVFILLGVGVALLLAIVVIAAANTGRRSDSSGGSYGGALDDSSGAASQAQWVLVASLSGDTDKTGQVFTLQGGEQRLDYDIASTAVSEYGDMAIAGIYVVDAGTDLSTEGGFPEVSPDGGGADSTSMYKSAGDYYLAVTAANCNWAVNVYELR